MQEYQTPYHSQDITNPANALSFLHGIGITNGEFNTTNWTPKAAEPHPTARHLRNADLENILQQIHPVAQEAPLPATGSCTSSALESLAQVNVSNLAAL